MPINLPGPFRSVPDNPDAVADRVVEVCGPYLEAIQKKFRIRTVRGNLSRSGTSALLCNEPGGFVVILDHKAEPVLIPRYMAHEIGHTMFYDYRADHPRRTALHPPSQSEESFCNAFADALLERCGNV